METIIKVYKKYKEQILYVFFGGVTVLVNFFTYFLFNLFFNFSYITDNIIAWIFAVVFAYITNRLWVFESKNKTLRMIVKEASLFFFFRLISGLIDTLCMFLLIGILKVDELISKIFVNIIVIILNYIFSKIIIFNNKQ